MEGRGCGDHNKRRNNIREDHTDNGNAAVALAQALRRSEKEFASLKVFRCPMTKAVFPGAPASAEWMQLKPVIHNPYMGVQMQDCGTEVK